MSLYVRALSRVHSPAMICTGSRVISAVAQSRSRLRVKLSLGLWLPRGTPDSGAWAPSDRHSRGGCSRALTGARGAQLIAIWTIASSHYGRVRLALRNISTDRDNVVNCGNAPNPSRRDRPRSRMQRSSQNSNPSAETDSGDLADAWAWWSGPRVERVCERTMIKRVQVAVVETRCSSSLCRRQPCQKPAPLSTSSSKYSRRTSVVLCARLSHETDVPSQYSNGTPRCQCQRNVLRQSCSRVGGAAVLGPYTNAGARGE